MAKLTNIKIIGGEYWAQVNGSVELHKIDEKTMAAYRRRKAVPKILAGILVVAVAVGGYLGYYRYLDYLSEQRTQAYIAEKQAAADAEAQAATEAEAAEKAAALAELQSGAFIDFETTPAPESGELTGDGDTVDGSQPGASNTENDAVPFDVDAYFAQIEQNNEILNTPEQGEYLYEKDYWEATAEARKRSEEYIKRADANGDGVVSDEEAYAAMTDEEKAAYDEWVAVGENWGKLSEGTLAAQQSDYTGD